MSRGAARLNEFSAINAEWIIMNWHYWLITHFVKGSYTGIFVYNIWNIYLWIVKEHMHVTNNVCYKSESDVLNAFPVPVCV